MKIKWITWINFGCFILSTACAVVCFCVKDNIVTGFFNVFAALLNLWIFLEAVSRWWEGSEKVANKYRFKCKYCGFQNVPTFWTWFLVPHIGSRRYLRCEACNDQHFMRRKERKK